MNTVIQAMRLSKNKVYEEPGFIVANELLKKRAFILGGHTIKNDCTKIMIN